MKRVITHVGTVLGSHDPKHTSSLVQQWLGRQDLSVLEWPPQSPDLNPIEHLWNEVDRRLRLFGTSPTCKDDLWEKIQVFWQNIEVKYVHKLIRTMPLLHLYNINLESISEFYM